VYTTPDMKMPLRPYQEEGVRFIERLGGRALIADDMGIGKTVQALGYLSRHPEALPALVVCPSGLRVQWAREISRFTHLHHRILSSKSSVASFRRGGIHTFVEPRVGFDGITIMNYDLFDAQTVASWVKELLCDDTSNYRYVVEAGRYAMRWLEAALKRAPENECILSAIREIEAQGKRANWKKYLKVSANKIPIERFFEAGRWKTVVFDEIHYLMDAKSKRGMAALELSSLAKHVIGLTGTLIKNRPIEAYNPVRVINPRVFPDFMAYARRYCGAKHNGFGWQFTGSSNLDELYERLCGSIMLRRRRSEVLSELPPLETVMVPIVLMDRYKEYEREAKPVLERLSELKRKRSEWKETLSGMSASERRHYLSTHAAEAVKAAFLTGIAFGEIEKAKQAAMRAKYPEALEFVLETVISRGKVVVFASHIETVDRLTADLVSAGILADKIHGGVSQERRIAAKDRFQDGDLQVLVCGIRAASEGLTLTASSTVVFVEFDWNPATHEQAIARVHRMTQTKGSIAYYLVGVGTIEEKIVRMIDAKREVFTAAMGDDEQAQAGILDSLLEEIVP